MVRPRLISTTEKRTVFSRACQKYWSVKALVKLRRPTNFGLVMKSQFWKASQMPVPKGMMKMMV